MAESQRLLDIWIVESNTAYSGVPFETVANWLQQGRLLAEDRVRPAGGKEWYRIGKVRALVPYLPRLEPHRVEDAAEALEPVVADLTWRNPSHDEEDDPDMIPLIDISLVLLIFFMMTAAVESGLFAPIDTPSAYHQLLSIKENTYIVAIDKDAAGKPRFGLGKDEKELEAAGQDMSHVLARLKKELAQIKEEVRISLRADRQLPVEIVKAATLELQGLEAELNASRDQPIDRVKFHIMGEVQTLAK